MPPTIPYHPPATYPFGRTLQMPASRTLSALLLQYPELSSPAQRRFDHLAAQATFLQSQFPHKPCPGVLLDPEADEILERISK